MKWKFSIPSLLVLLSLSSILVSCLSGGGGGKSDKKNQVSEVKGPNSESPTTPGPEAGNSSSKSGQDPLFNVKNFGDPMVFTSSHLTPSSAEAAVSDLLPGSLMYSKITREKSLAIAGACDPKIFQLKVTSPLKVDFLDKDCRDGTWSLNTLTFKEEGKYTLTLQGQTKEGKNLQIQLQLVYDLNSPDLMLNIPHKLNGKIITNSKQNFYEGTCSSDMSSLQVTQGTGIELKEINCEANKFSLETTEELKLGDNLFELQGADGAGNMKSLSFNIYYNPNPAKASIDYPSTGATYETKEHKVQLRGSCDKNVDNLVLLRGREEIALINNCKENHTWRTNDISLSVGFNVFNLNASDSLGNIIIKTLRVKLIPPEAIVLSVTEPIFALRKLENLGKNSGQDLSPEKLVFETKIENGLTIKGNCSPNIISLTLTSSLTGLSLSDHDCSDGLWRLGPFNFTKEGVVDLSLSATTSEGLTKKLDLAVEFDKTLPSLSLPNQTNNSLRLETNTLNNIFEGRCNSDVDTMKVAPEKKGLVVESLDCQKQGIFRLKTTSLETGNNVFDLEGNDKANNSVKITLTIAYNTSGQNQIGPQIVFTYPPFSSTGAVFNLTNRDVVNGFSLAGTCNDQAKLIKIFHSFEVNGKTETRELKIDPKLCPGSHGQLGRWSIPGIILNYGKNSFFASVGNGQGLLTSSSVAVFYQEPLEISGKTQFNIFQDDYWKFTPDIKTDFPKEEIAFICEGLPPGLTCDDANKEISGYPQRSGIFENIKIKVHGKGLYPIEKTHTFRIEVMGDPLKHHAWHLKNEGQATFSQTGGIPGEDIKWDEAYRKYSIKGSKIKIAISDSSADLDHPDLKNNWDDQNHINFLCNDSSCNDSWPMTKRKKGSHATSVAGIIGAEGWNNLGSRGVAPEAHMSIFNFLDEGVASSGLNNLILQAKGKDGSNFDIMNQSWGSDWLPDKARWSSYIEKDYLAFLKTQVQKGRDGKGIIYVKSSGNDGNRGEGPDGSKAWWMDCNADPYNTNPYTIVVGALNAKGEKSSYSTNGSCLWVSAPGGEDGSLGPAILSTDDSGCDKGYSTSSLAKPKNKFENGILENPDCDYTSVFNGTSSAAPMVTGMIALLLEQKKDLTWRDVKYILAKTSTKIQPNDPGWIVNQAGFHFHPHFGFGRINLEKALKMAKNDFSPSSPLQAYREFIVSSTGSPKFLNENGEEWACNASKSNCNLEASTNWLFQTANNLNVTIPDNNPTGITRTWKINHENLDNFFLEAVMIDVDIEHELSGEIGLELTSPSGTKSVLLKPGNGFNRPDLKLVLLSNAFYGEKANGEWKLKIYDEGTSGKTGKLLTWKINFAGHKK